MMPVQFCVELHAGWADCHVQIGGVAATVTASYLTDGLGDLAAAVERLLAGAAHAAVTFEEEPGEFRWALEREGADRLRIRITASRGLAAEPSRGDDVSVLEARCGLREFAVGFSEGLAALQVARASDYAAAWGIHSRRLSWRRSTATSKPTAAEPPTSRPTTR